MNSHEMWEIFNWSYSTTSHGNEMANKGIALRAFILLGFGVKIKVYLKN